MGCEFGGDSRYNGRMILNTGQRTDIPAFFSKWLLRRVEEGYALARNPFCPERVTRYRISPDVVDAIAFCTKDPRPMIGSLSALRGFAQLWFVTITPYGRDIEPGAPPKSLAIAALRELSARLGPAAVAWRYDPVLITEKYSVSFHIRAFGEMAAALKGASRVCIASFIDLYPKTRRGFPQARAVPLEAQKALVSSFAASAAKAGMRLKLCAESLELAECGADVSGCMTEGAIEEAAGFSVSAPAGKARARKACACLLGSDIGAYDTCAHGCLYCYANSSPAAVKRNVARHDPESPFLVGGFLPGDTIRDADQESWRTGQAALCFGT